MRILMIILTLFFIYPLCPDEINLTANEQIEVLDCDFDEEQVEGEISLSRNVHHRVPELCLWLPSCFTNL